jgi:hypothetical protein
MNKKKIKARKKNNARHIKDNHNPYKKDFFGSTCNEVGERAPARSIG